MLVKRGSVPSPRGLVTSRRAVFGVALLGFLLGWIAALLCAGAMALGPFPAPKPETRSLARLREALRDCERRLVEARTSVVNAPDRGGGYVAVARLEKSRRDLLTLISEAEGTKERAGTPEPGLDRLAEAARAALRLGLPRREQLEACYLLAFAERERGKYLAEAAALEEAVRLEPDSARLWLHLSGAYGRARQFRRAEGAQSRALALVERRP